MIYFKSMITAKEAVEKAAEYLQSLVPMSRPPVLEEIERDGAIWRITLSFTPPGNNPYGLVIAGTDKEYKIFTVGENGDILSMKIRILK